MPALNTGPAFTSAVTDLINSLLLIPILLSLRKKLPPEHASSRMWMRLLSLAGVASFLGFVAHAFRWKLTGYIFCWSVLYPVMLMVCNDFLRLGLYASSCGRLPSEALNRTLTLLALLCWAALIILFILRKDEPILLFMVYAVATVIPGFCFHIRLALRGHRGARTMIAAFLPLLGGAVLMFLQTGSFVFILPFDHNSIMHLCITFSFVIFYFAARIWERDTPAL